jgi:hypothetical protein
VVKNTHFSLVLRMGDEEVILGDTVASHWDMSENITNKLFNDERPKNMRREIVEQIQMYLDKQDGV